MPITQTLVMEVPNLVESEQRLKHVVKLVDLAETMGFPLNGFLDENDLLRIMRDVELELLSEYIYKKDHNFPSESLMSSELDIEKYHVVSCKILTALDLTLSN